STPAYTPPSGFTIKGTADLDGDGQTDVLLWNATTNVTQLQLIKDGVGQSPITLPSWSGWPVQGFADLNGDGKKDVLYASGASQATRDIVTDFTVGSDKLDLSALDQFRFLGNGVAFDGKSDALHTISSGGNTIVEGDINGDKVADFQIELTGSKALTQGDFTT